MNKKSISAMFATDKKYRISSGSSYVIDIEVSGEVINACTHAGPCDEDVAACMALPEVKDQLDAICEETLNQWWEEFFCDDTPEEHASADRTNKLAWLLFDACCNALDGDYEEIPI